MLNVDYSSANFSKNFQRYLRYHPINEFEFFYESIGISYEQLNGVLPAGKFFIDQKNRVFNVACGLWAFGFPWTKLGMLYVEERSIFDWDVREIKGRLEGFKEFGFDNMMIIGMCLAFPFVLSRRQCGLLSGKIDALFHDLRKVFVDYDLVSRVQGNWDPWFDVCRKIRIFYDLGCPMGRMGELMGRSKNVFVDYPEEFFVQKVGFFSKLGVNKEEIGCLLLSRSDILKFDLETPCISVLGFLKYFGLEEDKLRFVMKNYPYVFGRNRLANLPHVMKSMDLNEWFFDKMKNGDHTLLDRYVIGSPEEDLDKTYTDYLVKIQSTRLYEHMLCRLEVFHGFGFGENKYSVKLLNVAHGSGTELQARFDCLLGFGIEFSNLCKMISRSPKILNQKTDLIEQKVNYLREDIGVSLQCLDSFPAYLCYNFEKRIKARYSFYMWLRENNLCPQEYSLPSLIATCEKSFIANVYRMHPAAPKKWLESFLSKDPDSNFQEPPFV